MKEEFLTYPDCIKRIEHSFIKRVSYFGRNLIDFQHPSIRDMLLRILQDDPYSRLYQIINASAVGLASIIIAIPKYGKKGEEASHFLVLQNAKEIDSLLKRINTVMMDTIPFTHAKRLIESTKYLLPLGMTQYLSTDEIHLADFNRSLEGRIARAILEQFAAVEYFENNSHYDCEDWVSLIDIYYDISSYFRPNIHIQYTDRLIYKVKESDSNMSMRIIPTLIKNESLFDRTILSKEYLSNVMHEIKHQIDEYCSEGDNINSTVPENRAQYEELEERHNSWMNDVEEYLNFVECYFETFGNDPNQFIANLDDLWKSVSIPDESDYPYDVDDVNFDRDDKNSEYWTLKVIYDDL